MSKDKVRLYVLARELDIESKDLIDRLKAVGVEVRNHMSALDAETRKLAEDLVSGKIAPTPKPAPVKETPRPAPARPAEQSIPSPEKKRLGQLAPRTRTEPEAKPSKPETPPPSPEPLAKTESAAEKEPKKQAEPKSVPEVLEQPAPAVAETKPEIEKAAQPAKEPEPKPPVETPVEVPAVAKTPPPEKVEPAPAKEKEVEPVAEPEPAPPAAAKTEPEKPPVPEKPKEPPRRATPIPSPNVGKPGVISGSSQNQGTKTAKPARSDRRSARPRPIIAAPPPSVAKAQKPVQKKKPEVAAQKPVMKISPEAVRKGQVVLPGIEKTPFVDLTAKEVFEEEEKKQRKGAGVSGREARQRRRAARRERLDDDDTGEQIRRTAQRVRTRKQQQQQVMQRSGPVVLESPITVRSFSLASGIPTRDLLRRLMNQGLMINVNQTLTEQQAEELALEFDLEVEFKRAKDVETWLVEQAEEDQPEDLKLRPPVVTFMGHVDHGKTSLMDRIRSTHVAAGESGGITQHIGAYTVDSKFGLVTFLDTPGHEAFTAMRSRGAKVTDIVVLVVAVDDGVMPQTEEAISHAKAAGVPIVVALNKIDLPGVNVDKVLQQLTRYELIPEEWGGETQMVKTSAATGEGIDELLETLNLVAEIEELKANPNRPATGLCIEASLSEGRGVQSTLLVRNGTLRQGDIVVCGTAYGKVRAMLNDRNEPVEAAGPSMPVVLSGLDVVPDAGEPFFVLDDLSKAREIAEERRFRQRAQSQELRPHVTLETFFDSLQEKKSQELRLIIKADVRGSLEAIRKEVMDLDNEEVHVRIIHEGVGGISESDVLLADASDAIIIGFHVVADDRAEVLAGERGVEIRRYEIIYQVSDDIRKALEGMLEPEKKEVQLGRVVVQETFTISRVGTIAGCRVVQGTVERNAKVRIIRDGTIIGTYPLETLRRYKDDVKEVREGMECGIKLAGFNDIKRGDVLEAFKIEEIRRTL